MFIVMTCLLFFFLLLSVSAGTIVGSRISRSTTAGLFVHDAGAGDTTSSASVAAAAAAASSTAATDGHRRLHRQLNNNNLSAIWTIPEPSLSYDQTTNVLQLTWEINDIIEDTQLEFTFYDSDCQVGGGSTISTSGTGYSVTTSLPSTQVGDGSGTRQFKMELSTQIPQITLNNNPKLYFTDEDRFKMCVRLGLSTPSSEYPQEVNWSETLVDLNFDLLNQGFSMNDAVDVYPPEGKCVCVCLFRSFVCSLRFFTVSFGVQAEKKDTEARMKRKGYRWTSGD